MQFKDVIGQEDVKQHLVEMVQHNRLSHALLFLGKEGSGALPLAMALAQYISCETVNRPALTEGPSLFGEPDPVPTAIGINSTLQTDSCGTCPSCIKASQLAHPDIHFSYPTIKRDTKHEKPISTDYIVQWRDFIKQMPYGNDKDWIDFIKQHTHDKIDNPANKQGNITAHECNDIIRKLNLKSFESGYKILIMWMPEYLDKEGNKLLKLIEEPPADTLFILVAESEDQILSTILSRCQLVKIPAIDNEAIEKALMERSKIASDQAKQIANISEGNYREALHILQHASEDYGNLLKEWLNATLKNQVPAQLKCIEEISRMGRENQKQFLKYFIHLIEQAIRIKAIGERNDGLMQALPPFEQDFVPRLNKAMSLEQQEAITEELDKASYYIERNANSKILFHALTIKIFHIVRNNVMVR